MIPRKRGSAAGRGMRDQEDGEDFLTIATPSAPAMRLRGLFLVSLPPLLNHPPKQNQHNNPTPPPPPPPTPTPPPHHPSSAEEGSFGCPRCFVDAPIILVP